MSATYPKAGDALAAALYRRTVTTVSRAPNVSSACGVSVRQGGRTTDDDPQRAERGEYLLSLPHDATLELSADELVTISGESNRIFRVVWRPVASNLGLSRRYGLEEVR